MMYQEDMAALTACVAALIGVDPARVRPEDELEALGMDSLSPMKLIRRLEDAGWGLTLRDYRASHTVAELALHLKPLREKAAALTPLPEFPADYSLRLLSGHRLESRFAADRVFTKTALLARLDALCRVHPALRYTLRGDLLVPGDAPFCACEIHETEVGPEALSSQTPNLFVSVHRQSGTRSAFYMSVPHVCADGYSMNLLKEELLGRTPPRQEDGFVALQTARSRPLTSPEKLRDLRYWIAALDGVPPATLPASDYRAVRLPPAATPSRVIHAYGAVLLKRMGTDSAAFLVMTSGRNDGAEGISRTVGCISRAMPAVIRRGQDAAAFADALAEGERHLSVDLSEISSVLYRTALPPITAPALISEVFPPVDAPGFVDLDRHDYSGTATGAFLYPEDGALVLAGRLDPALLEHVKSLI